MTARRIWSEEELEAARKAAIQLFRQSRVQEPLDAYLASFDDYSGILEDLLEQTVDLSRLRTHALDVVTDSKAQEALRFITGPPISADDLKVLAEATLTGSRLKAEPEMVERIIDTVLAGLDRRRFAWISERREATAPEREAAVLATAALIATSKTMTQRRNEGKTEQESAVEQNLQSVPMSKVPTRAVRTIDEAPDMGSFCRETTLAGAKADFVVRLFDGRVMPLECKVSNSSTNSVKRLNREAASKAEIWIKDLGAKQILPTAILSGVFKLKNLIEAQDRGLTIFWANDLDSLVGWIRSAIK